MSVRICVLLVATMLVAACGGSSSSPSPTPNPTPTPAPTPAPQGTTVTIPQGARSLTTTAYAPNPITVSVGTAVTWTNNDTIAHTATANNGAFDTGNLAAGSSKTITMSTAGSFPYHCTIHPGMVATINVQ
jgi:plastocyanin